MNTLKLISVLAVFVAGVLLMVFGMVMETDDDNCKSLQLVGVAMIGLAFCIAL